MKGRIEMASLKEIVSLPGTLRGEGQQSECVVLATKVTLPGPDIVAYAEHQIRNVSKSLPEGRYSLSVHGEVLQVRHQGGHWLSD
jgi:hypothetical protein